MVTNNRLQISGKKTVQKVMNPDSDLQKSQSKSVDNVYNNFVDALSVNQSINIAGVMSYVS